MARLLLAAALLAVPGSLAPGAAAPVVLAGSPLVPPAIQTPVRQGPAAPEAAPPELQITTAARYDVQPDKRRIHVTLDATITNTHRDTGSTRTYYDTGYLAVLPDTEHFGVTSPGARPTVSVRSANRSYTLLTIRLGRRLFAGRHTPLRLTFDMPDRGGAALGDVRVGDTLVAFPAWAFATAATPGSRVSVVFPPGYKVQLQSGDVPGPTSGKGGTQVYATEPLESPLGFSAYFVADRPGAFKDTSIVATVAGAKVPVTVRAWADDPAWGTRVASLVRRGLPALSTAIGLPYSGDGLVVQETVSRTIGGYAGLFDPVTAAIQVAFYASSFVVLHETAHAWFNGRLVSDRWISEAFASYYAQRASSAIRVDVEPPSLTADLLAVAIPLNAWAGVGRADEATEDYAYAASYKLAGLIAARAGTDGMRAVWRAAARGEYPYQPFRAGSAPERGAPPPDWRGLLDLLDERTTSEYADLWRTWVVRPSDRALLDARSAARSAYASAVVAAGEWELPPAVRSAMSAWQFDQAAALLVQIEAVLARRTEIASAAAEAGLTLPATLRATFEGSNGPAAAAAEAARELEAIDAIVAAELAGHDVGWPFEQIGLLGLGPEGELVAARQAFAEGDLTAAMTRAANAQATWQTAASRGQQRVLSGAVVVVGLVLAAFLAAAAWRAHRGRRRERAPF